MVLPAVRNLVQHCTGTLGPNGEAAPNTNQSATLERRSGLDPASLDSKENETRQTWDNFIHTTVGFLGHVPAQMQKVWNSWNS